MCYPQSDTKEVIDLTNNDPPEEFGMLVDLPSDEDDKDDKMAVVKEEPEESDGGFYNSDGEEEVEFGDEEAAYDIRDEMIYENDEGEEQYGYEGQDNEDK